MHRVKRWGYESGLGVGHPGWFVDDGEIVEVPPAGAVELVAWNG